MHGGKSLQGIASPRFRTGKWIKSGVLPSGLAKYLPMALEAGLSLAEDVALLDAKVMELFEQLRAGQSPDAWRRVADVARELRQAQRDFDAARKAARPTDILAALSALDAGIAKLEDAGRAGLSSMRTWGQILEVFDQKNKMVTTEVRRRKAEHEALDRQRVLALMAFLAQTIAKHVPDPRAKQAIIDDLRPVLTASGVVDA